MKKKEDKIKFIIEPLKKEKRKSLGSDLIIKDSENEVFFSSELFIQLFIGVKSGLVDEKIINAAIEEYLSYSDPIYEGNKEKALSDLKKNYLKLASLIEEGSNHFIKSHKAAENTSESFINTFSDIEKLNKLEIAKLCNMSEGWVHLHKDNFKQNSNGVYLKSFTTWLFKFNEKTFLVFKKNYKEKFKKK